MNRIKYEQYHGAAGYDAVARRKIKELEKKIGTGSNMVEKVLLDEPEAELRDNNGMIGNVFLINSSINPGQIYKVEIDGNVYERVAYEMTIEGTTVAFIGNMALTPMPDTEDTGEPFIIMYTEEGGDKIVQIIVSVPTTYDAIDNIVLSIKITTMEEKPEGGNVVGFYLGVDRKYHCTETYADAKKLIFENYAAISFVDYVANRCLTAFTVDLVKNDGGGEYMNITVWEGGSTRDKFNFYLDNTFENMNDPT